jgi:hypothetical protein
VNDWKIIFATVVIFGAGVISGGLLVNYADLAHLKAVQPVSVPLDATNVLTSVSTNHPPTPKPGNPVKARLPEILSKQFVDRLEGELQLTLGQRADVEKIIADEQDEMRKAVQNVRQDARQKIREKLTDPQRKRFDDLFKQWHGGKKAGNGTNAPSLVPPPAVPTNNIPAV